MLGKRDPIFWAATFIFVVALVLMVAVDESWILLMLASYLLRPTLHSVGLAPKLIDERQLAIQYRSTTCIHSTTATCRRVTDNKILLDQVAHSKNDKSAALAWPLGVGAIATEGIVPYCDSIAFVNP